MTTENKMGRLAGAFYFIVVVTGMFSLVYVPSQISVANALKLTVQNIVGLEPLFRLGIASFLVNQVAYLLLPLVLFRLFYQTSQSAAVIMVALATVSVPISLVSLINRLDILSLLLNPAVLPEELQSKVKLALDSYSNGLHITSVFWGLWLFPFGYLVLKSGYLPKFFGIFLILGCFGYMTDVFGELLISGYADTLVANFASLPAAIGEIGTCFWLLIFGIRVPKINNLERT